MNTFPSLCQLTFQHLDGWRLIICWLWMLHTYKMPDGDILAFKVGIASCHGGGRVPGFWRIWKRGCFSQTWWSKKISNSTQKKKKLFNSTWCIPSNRKRVSGTARKINKKSRLTDSYSYYAAAHAKYIRRHDSWSIASHFDLIDPLSSSFLFLGTGTMWMIRSTPMHSITMEPYGQ